MASHTLSIGYLVYSVVKDLSIYRVASTPLAAPLAERPLAVRSIGPTTVELSVRAETLRPENDARGVPAFGWHPSAARMCLCRQTLHVLAESGPRQLYDTFAHKKCNLLSNLLILKGRIVSRDGTHESGTLPRSLKRCNRRADPRTQQLNTLAGPYVAESCMVCQKCDP